MSIAERRSRDKVELGRKIQDAARAFFIEEGYEKVSMRKIAHRIGYAPSTIYLHFRDKVDLVASICVEVFAELDRRLDAIIEKDLPPMETLRQCLREYVQFGLDHPGNYGFVFCTPLSVLTEMDAQSQDAIQKCGQGSFQRLRRAIQACMNSGGIPAGDVESVSQSTWLLTHGITSGLIVDRGFPFLDRERLIDESLDRIFRGLI